jgi:hypothetical protein
VTLPVGLVSGRVSGLVSGRALGVPSGHERLVLAPGRGQVATRTLVPEQARLEVGLEDEQLALGGPARPGVLLAAKGDTVPCLRERDQARAPAGAMRRQHRADAVGGGVGADDDVVARDPLQHRGPGAAGQAVDRLSQVLDGRSAPGSHSLCRPTGERLGHCTHRRRAPQAIPWRRKEPCT